MPLISNIKSTLNQRRRRQAPDWEKILVKDTVIKDAIQNKPNGEEMNNSVIKVGQRHGQTAHRRRQRWQTSAGKMLHTQRLSSGKCKFKQQ